MELSSLIRETPQLTLRPLRPEDYAAFLSGFRACGPARNRFDDGQFDLSFLTEDWYAGLLARRQQEAEADISYVLNLFRREDGASVGYCDIPTQQREDFQWGRIGYTVLNRILVNQSAKLFQGVLLALHQGRSRKADIAGVRKNRPHFM